MTGALARPDGGKIITFYSYKGGTGRTMALANTAWIMASQGRRVLVVDWDLEAPGLDRFLRPFLEPHALRDRPGVLDLINDYMLKVESLGEVGVDEEWVDQQAGIGKAVSPLQWHFPRGGALDFISAGRQDRNYSSIFSQFNWTRFYEEQYGGQFLDAVCAQFRRGYDYVLVDSRTGLSDISDICTLHFPDVLVNCFTHNDQSIEGAAAVARRVVDTYYHDRRIRILPVPMRVVDSEADRLEAARAKVRVTFDQLLMRTPHVDVRRYWGNVELPYKPTYAYEEMLATFRDEPGTPTSLLAACERLTSVITEGDVTCLDPMTDEERQNYLKAVVRRRPPDPTHVFLSHVPEDQMWADWIRRVLADAGFTVGDARSEDGSAAGVPLRDDTDSKVRGASRTVAVLSAAYQKSPEARAVWEAVAAADPMGARRTLVPVRVSDVRLGHPFSDRTPIHLGNMNETQARNVLLRALDAPVVQDEHPADATVPGPRFPGAEPPVWSVPVRNAAFTGRAGMLENLRHRLGETGTATLLHGMGGVGKTQLATEYAYRYRGNYDVVWWIEAEFGDLALRQYSELAPHLGVEERDSISATADAVRDALRRGATYDRWLLIFDNATTPESIERLLVNSPTGHVLITTRNEGWAQIGERVEVDVFARAESVEHLLHRVSAISTEDADRVAEALGDLPLAVDQAAAWLNETGQDAAEYLALLEPQLASLEAVADAQAFPLQVGATWNISIQQLNAPVALRLLQLCAHFGADPISFDLVHGKEMGEALIEAQPGGEGTALVSRAIQQLHRYALAKVDRKSRSIQVHRLVQAAVRSSMSEEEREDALRVVRNVLSGARPSEGDVERPANWPRYNTIWPHLKTPWLRYSLDDRIRRLMTEWLRYLRSRGEYAEAMSLAEELLTVWKKEAGATDRWTLHLRFEIANVLRFQGWYGRALDIDEDVYERQREVLGEDDSHTLMTAGSLTADLRAVGRVKDALKIDRKTYERSVDLLGEDHPRTLNAANNLAVSMRMAGDCYEAESVDKENCDLRVLTMGAKHPYTLGSRVNLGRDQRSCGEYEASEATLRAVYETAKELGPTSPPALEAAKALAITLRRLDKLDEAIELSQSVLDIYRLRLPDASPETLVVRLGLAGHLAAAERYDEACAETSDLLDRFRAALGETHPNTLACAVNHGINLLSTGQPARSHDVCEQARGALRTTLGPDHPFSMNCQMNLANAEAAVGDIEQAERNYRQAHRELSDRLGGDHPTALTCQGNFSIMLREAGRTEEADHLAEASLTVLSAKLGNDHSKVARLRAGRRVGLELDPHPI
ncbi:FxSxx-COOH system tetratricopeptide repeat protein [Streptomyces justiciae]|uniref:FxSxx-COOH system tetratricopeptide repeat protein n=1 Tax=Streptomyces justiciae TaxID=2780140 RepID=A0ABU3LT30_9ACTN|nr:FxSxx-COOH system tetratricopeptide repeat protein [Streptomyces justiciae]MDT7841909.1 FxSxx-COOH system tetratricopeptide repeat protein [Streptomyces justiciae]